MSQTSEDLVTAEQPAEPDGPADASPARRRRLGLTAVLAALLALLLVATVVLGVLYVRERAEAEEREDALATAQRFAANFLSVSVNEFDAATAEVLADTTGDAQEEYQAGLEALRTQLEESGSSAQGSVLSRGMVSMTEDTAEVLVVADSEVTRAEEFSNVLHYRMRLSLEEVDGAWKVAQVDFVQA